MVLNSVKDTRATACVPIVYVEVPRYQISKDISVPTMVIAVRASPEIAPA